MTQPTPNQAELRELLTRRLDGQLAGDEASAFESALRTAGPDSDLALDAARGSALRDLLADVPQGLGVDSPGDLAFERVRRNIQAATTGAVAAPAAKRAARGGAATKTAPGRAMYGGLVAAAAAAAVALVSFGPGPSVGVPSVPSTAASNGTEIVHVEFGKVSGTYWEQSEGSDRVAIVWIDDTVIEEVGRP